MMFSNKIVVITGAANGIGKNLALSYADQGAYTVIIDKEESALEATKEAIKNKGSEVLSFGLDLTKPDEIEKAFVDIRAQLKKVDILINNAGLGAWKSIYEITVEDWDYVINSNLRAAFLCAKEAAMIMKEKDGGSIVNIASTRALMSEPNTFPYSASKGGILALTHSLAVSLGPDKIRVNAISPGWIQTENYDKLRKVDHEQHPAGRVGKTDDIVRACFYLTDPENDYVTGTNLVVDGGMTKKMIYEE